MIGHPGDKDRVTGHVLGNFTKADRGWLNDMLMAIVQAAPVLVEGDDARFMSDVALIAQSAKGKIETRQRKDGKGKRLDGFHLRHRRPAQCRQVDPV